MRPGVRDWRMVTVKVDRLPVSDRGRIGELYLQHAVAAVRLAYLLTGDRAVAEDLVQDAFVRLAGRLAKARPVGGGSGGAVERAGEALRATAGRHRPAVLRGPVRGPGCRDPEVPCRNGEVPGLEGAGAVEDRDAR